MAKQASVVQDGVDQVREAVRVVDQGFRRIQKQVETRRRRLTKELTSRRRLIEKRAQRELERLQKQIQKQPIVKRAEALRVGASERFERGVSSFLDALPIATKSDVERIDRKVSALGRKLKGLEKGQGISTEA
ncbi:MAG: hypothetical protein NTZ61_08065 [Proteobacteria bacterium]|nr:hypothetical protein [Pseudomonadota bacterium]